MKVDLLIGGATFMLLAGLTWWAMSPGRPGPSRGTSAVARLAEPRPELLAGDRSCRECHPGESAHHARSGHARTLRPAAGQSLALLLDGRSVDDPESPGVTWTYALRDGRFVVRRAEAGQAREVPIDFAFGSGHHATTFVTLTGTEPTRPIALEHRLTYFARSGSLDVTPGQAQAMPDPARTPIGLVHTTAETLKCFKCHSTVISARGQGELDPATMVANVSCERCHGPGGPHVVAARRGAGPEDLAMPFGDGRWTADDQMRLCGQCHRHPETGKPGRIRRDNPEIVRFQPVGLMQSRCYRESRGALSCVTCHDPHARASSDHDAYEAACLACHRGPPRSTCPVSPRGGCIGCHMPRRDAGQKVLFTDHWIGVNPGDIPGRDPTKPAAPGTSGG